MINLVKLSVGVDTVEALAVCRAKQAHGAGYTDSYVRHRTRSTPKRKDALIAGGSIFWVLAGKIQCRQLIVDMESGVDSAGRRFCDIVMDRMIVRTVPTPKRPFQGWRYLTPEDAPSDLPMLKGDDNMQSRDLAGELAMLGLI